MTKSLKRPKSVQKPTKTNKLQLFNLLEPISTFSFLSVLKSACGVNGVHKGAFDWLLDFYELPCRHLAQRTHHIETEVTQPSKLHKGQEDTVTLYCETIN